MKNSTFWFILDCGYKQTRHTKRSSFNCGSVHLIWTVIELIEAVNGNQFKQNQIPASVKVLYSKVYPHFGFSCVYTHCFHLATMKLLSNNTHAHISNLSSWDIFNMYMVCKTDKIIFLKKFDKIHARNKAYSSFKLVYCADHVWSIETWNRERMQCWPYKITNSQTSIAGAQDIQ